MTILYSTYYVTQSISFNKILTTRNHFKYILLSRSKITCIKWNQIKVKSNWSFYNMKCYLILTKVTNIKKQNHIFKMVKHSSHDL